MREDMQISVARLQMTLSLPPNTHTHQKREIMIKNYSVAWQASGWLSCEYLDAGRELGFHRAATSPGSLDSIHLLRKKKVLTCDQCKQHHRFKMFLRRCNPLMI
jgi:hypothetical protein